jgi:GTP cyclohydrolase I
MAEEKRYLEDVGMKNLPFPMKVTSKADPKGQLTIANISVSARIMHEFQAQWIDKFIQIVHSHRETIGTSYLKSNIRDYLKGLGASAVRVDFEYPFFVEKVTPASKEKCLVRYMCTFSAKVSAVRDPKIQLKMEIPVITTFPETSKMLVHRPFGQLSAVLVEVESSKDVYPEDLVEIVDRHSLSGIYSFLTPEDQDFIIQRIRSNSKSSVIMVDEIKDELAHKENVSWFSVNCSNFGMLHPYSTVIGTEKSMWIPETDVEDYELL